MSNSFLKNPLWDTAATKQRLANAVSRSRKELKEEIRQAHLNSPASGKTYRVGAKAGVVAGARRLHKASRKGEAPSKRSGALEQSIETEATGELSGEVFTELPYGAILDDPEKLDRPFFKKTARGYRVRFRENIVRAHRAK